MSGQNDTLQAAIDKLNGTITKLGQDVKALAAKINSGLTDTEAADLSAELGAIGDSLTSIDTAALGQPAAGAAAGTVQA